MEINGAPVTLEDREVLAPGETRTVRLHPILRDAWPHVQAGAQIDMHAESKVVGKSDRHPFDAARRATASLIWFVVRSGPSTR
jgi:hypothetical protein